MSPQCRGGELPIAITQDGSLPFYSDFSFQAIINGRHSMSDCTSTSSSPNRGPNKKKPTVVELLPKGL